MAVMRKLTKNKPPRFSVVITNYNKLVGNSSNKGISIYNKDNN